MKTFESVLDKYGARTGSNKDEGTTTLYIIPINVADNELTRERLQEELGV